MKVKVKDIAKAAGVSPTTVSLVLNNRPSRIAEDTKEHILRVAREMQFQKESEIDFSEFKKHGGAGCDEFLLSQAGGGDVETCVLPGIHGLSVLYE